MKFLYLIIFLSSLWPSQTTPYSFNLDRMSGMPSEIVYDVFQDKQSFIWFATAQGILRYDGLQVKTFASDHLTTKAVSNISEDLQGRIWFQDFDGTIYYIQNNKIKLFEKEKANGFLKYGIIDDHIFIASKHAIKVYRLTDFKLERSVNVDMRLFKHSISDKEKFYLIGEKIQYLDVKGDLNELPLPNDYTKSIPAPLPVLQNGKLYIFSKFGENYLEYNNQIATRHKLPFKNVFTQSITSSGDTFWLSSTKGIFHFDKKNNDYKHYFPENSISKIIKTSRGKYWISSLSSGAYFVENFKSNFIKIPAAVIKLSKQQQKIYFSTNNDKIFRIDQNKIELIHQGNSGHSINFFKLDSLNKRLFVASSKLIIKSKNTQLEHVLAVKEVTQLDKKYYAVSASTWNGIIYTNPEVKSDLDTAFNNYPRHSENGIFFISIIENENGKSNLYKPKENNLYFLTNYGIKLLINNQLKEIKNQYELTFTHMSMAKDVVYLLAEDDKIYYINPKNEIAIYRFKTGFTNDKIKNLRVANNHIYFTKNRTLYRYNPTYQYPEAILDLPLSIDFNDIIELNKELILATSKGIINIPKANKKTNNPIKLIINNVLVNGLSNNNLEQLKHNQNNVEILFDIISSAPNNSYKIKYKIDDNAWKSINNTERSLGFESLSYGKHNIELRIENGNIITNENFKLNIKAPFWLTWWGISLGVLLIIGLIYLYFQNKVKHINKKNEMLLAKSNLEKLANQSKLKSLKSQMNPHFYFNALNTLQSYILSNEKKEAVSYLSKFSRLTRNILNMSDQENQSVSEEIAMLNDYIDLEKIRFGESFIFDINIAKSISIQDIQIPSLITQPFVENAIKHGLMHKNGQKILNIKFEEIENYLKITIEDNGIGRRKSSELNAIRKKIHKSFATQAISERVNILNLQLQQKIKIDYIDHENPSGTTVIINLPKNQNY